MPKKKKVTPTPVRSLTLLFSVVAVTLALLLWLLSAEKLENGNVLDLRGNLEADVIFIGLSCPTPLIPCRNPRSNYPVRIRDQKTNDSIAVTLSDSEGHVSLSLPTGDYYWESNEKVIGGKKARVDFSIMTNQTATSEFVINLGIR